MTETKTEPAAPRPMEVVQKALIAYEDAVSARQKVLPAERMLELHDRALKLLAHILRSQELAVMALAAGEDDTDDIAACIDNIELAFTPGFSEDDDCYIVFYLGYPVRHFFVRTQTSLGLALRYALDTIQSRNEEEYLLGAEDEA